MRRKDASPGRNAHAAGGRLREHGAGHVAAPVAVHALTSFHALSAPAPKVLGVAGSGDISYLAFVGQSPHAQSTRDLRRRYLSEYVEWLREQGIDPLEVVASDVLRYMDSQEGRRARSTRDTVLHSIRAYYRWLEERGVIERSPVAQIRSEVITRRPAKSVPVDDVRRMLAAARSDQNWLIVALLTFNSLRISDVLALDVPDVAKHGDRHVLILREAPNHRPRVLVLVGEVVEVLERHLAGRRHGALFRNRAGERLGRVTASGVVDWTGRHAKLGYKVTPDMLTNTLTAVALERGFSYRGLARAVGTPERRHSERWLAAVDRPTDDNATVRLARLVFHKPESSTTALLVHLEALLNETDLPEPLAVAAAGAVFERHLRALCLAHDLDVRPNPKDGSIHGYVALLHGAKRITLRERHTCEQIGEARNNAAHGVFESVAPGAARQTLHALEEFIIAHPLPEAESRD